MNQAPYVASDVTQLPYRFLLKGGAWHWSWPLRLWFTFRKAVGWHFRATSGRRLATRLDNLELATLPSSIRPEFARLSSELGHIGFSPTTLVRSDTIGYLAAYSLMSQSDDQLSSFTANVTKIRVGSLENQQWSRSFRTDLSRDRVIITADRNSGFESFFPGGSQIEVLAADTSTENLWRRHQDRLAEVPDAEIVPAPTGNGMLVHAEKIYRYVMAAGLLRPLTPDEEAELKRINYDFN